MLVINRVMLHCEKWLFYLIICRVLLQDKWSESNFIKWSCSEFLIWYIAYQWHQVHYSLFGLVNWYVKWKVAMLQHFRDFHCLRVNFAKWYRCHLSWTWFWFGKWWHFFYIALRKKGRAKYVTWLKSFWTLEKQFVV